VEQLKSLSNIQENVSEKEDEETFRMEMSGLLNEMSKFKGYLVFCV